MLFLLAILGGLLIMMGQHSRFEALFYYYRLEDQVPETHLLRLIDKHISFAFVRETLKESYSDTGRPSIDPELLLRILLIGYLYGITSERKLVEELRMHLAWRWFTGLGFDQEIPHHSTFSKNRHGRFQEPKLFEQLFEQIVRQCVDAGLVQGKHLLGEAGIASVKLPPRSPNLNAHAERFVRTIKESCLERMILFGESAVRKATAEFMAHYHSERNHQGLANALICPEPEHTGGEGEVHRRERLGGLLNYYYRKAA